ncbi:MAG: MATE family efflux transporter, partial [Verrucomicrobiota bacterium]
MNLTEDPIPKLLRQIAIPASVGFFFNTMYNIVDTWFAGRLGTEAQAALSVSFPVFFLILAVGTGVSQGGTALISNALGEKDEEKAQHYAVQAVTFGFLLGLLLTVAGWLAAPAMFRQLGAEEYLDTSLLYMNTILAGTVFFLGASILNAGLNALGDTKTFRNLLIAGFFLNCLLNPWFIYGGFGVPPMGIRGIALATVLIQGIEIVCLVFVLRKTVLWKSVSGRHFVPDMKAFR